MKDIINEIFYNNPITEDESTDEKHTLERKEGYIYGEFDGTHLVAEEDGTRYPVPENYIGKSKLITGDELALKESEFTFAILHFTARRRGIGKIIFNDKEDCKRLLFDGKEYKIIFSLQRYFQLKEGDKVVCVVPRNGGEYCSIEDKL